jgi:hypothetical protein
MPAPGSDMPQGQTQPRSEPIIGRPGHCKLRNAYMIPQNLCGAVFASLRGRPQKAP